MANKKTSTSSPKTKALLWRVREMFSEKNIPLCYIRNYLNQHLPKARKLPDTKYGTLQVYRWFNPDADAWAEPSGEIVLAILDMERELSKGWSS